MTIADIQAICKKVFDLPQSNNFKMPRHDFVKETFMGNPDEFCQFMGWMQAELSKIKMRRDEAVSIMSDIALAAIMIGRKEGRDDALRSYGRPEFKFLLDDTKQGVIA